MKQNLIKNVEWPKISISNSDNNSLKVFFQMSRHIDQDTVGHIGTIGANRITT